MHKKSENLYISEIQSNRGIGVHDTLSVEISQTKFDFRLIFHIFGCTNIHLEEIYFLTGEFFIHLIVGQGTPSVVY